MKGRLKHGPWKVFSKFSAKIQRITGDPLFSNQADKDETCKELGSCTPPAHGERLVKRIIASAEKHVV